MGGLHQLVLSGAAPELARYYPTAGGTRPIEPERAQFRAALWQTADRQRDFLAGPIQNGTVQTNEAGRGSVWLLPLAIHFADQQWPAVDLLDLGASAGLNLLADRRSYHYFAQEDGETPLFQLGDLSHAQPEYAVQLAGDSDPLRGSRPQALPQIRRRVGCDLQPFPIKTEADKLRLRSYVWADHTDRMRRLQAGLDVLDRFKRAGGELELHQVRLPDQLPAFLENSFPDDGTPLIIYNTFITQYFKEKRPALRSSLAAWATTQRRPVLWLQWEPALDAHSGPPAEFGWLAWTADIWQSGEHTQQTIGTTHPHGLQLRIKGKG